MEQKTIQLELGVNEVDQILLAISKLPLEQVIDLFNKIRGQAISQMQSTKPTEESGDRSDS